MISNKQSFFKYKYQVLTKRYLSTRIKYSWISVLKYLSTMFQKRKWDLSTTIWVPEFQKVLLLWRLIYSST